jgi:uncharacterized coiled-coil protein SlyX
MATALRRRNEAPEEQAPPRPADAERTAVDDLAASVEHWTDEAADLDRKLADLDADAGRRVLDGEATADDLAAERRDLEGRIRTANDARAEAERRLQAARKAVLLAVADDLEQQAAAHQRRMDEHQAKVDRLLEQLFELDRWSYRPHTVEERIRVVYPDAVNLNDVTGRPVETAVRDQLAQPFYRLRNNASEVRRRAVDGMDAEAYRQALAFVDNRLADTEAAAT